MTGPRRRPGIAPGVRRPLGVALVVALALAWLAPVVGALPASPAAAANTDLTLVTNATYTVQPTHGRVHVVVAIDARNHRGETRTHKYYFDHAFLAVQPGASGFAISGAKGATVHVADRSKDATLLRIDFGARLYGGGGRSLELTFNLVDPGKPVNRQVRVGTGLVTFPVWAFASDGAKGSRVQVHFPAGYDVSVESGDFDSRTKGTDGGVTLSTQPLGEPLTYFSYLTAQREAVYKASPLTVDAGDRSIDLVVRGWRDDPAWAGRIGGLFRKALPQLTREIGLPWPETQPTVVQEAVSRAAGGYAGLFAPAERRIEVAYWADPLVVLHEAAHGWFNGGLVADRWASEGFASLYAQRAAGKLKVRDTSPKLTAAIGKAAIPLNAWPNTAGTTAGRTSPRRRTATRPPWRSPARSRHAPGTTPSSACGPRRARASAPTSPRRPARSATPAIPRRSTARPTGAACSTCSRPRRARTSPTCGASG